jgi:hypothetical protein
MENIYSEAIKDLKQIYNNIQEFNLRYSKLTQEQKDALMEEDKVEKLLPEVIAFGQKLSKLD